MGSQEFLSLQTLPILLTRRIPSNPKYQHIKTRLDTGNSLSKYMEKLEEIKRRIDDTPWMQIEIPSTGTSLSLM
ncbi:hypothetical protein DV515_00015306 [Chloebia gouldiae]|uniref:Uncharacterized protein n=1 Tax=Chloebia gouldiae TaxID=44316 RepID=A0A3L8RVW2_CHLGU|nr:hypothetical protein DV515_00015306 [Chloebia gouldiae]